MTVKILLTIAGTDTGPFLLFSDVDGFTSAFESGIPKGSLTYPGYTTSLVPNGTTIIRVRSVNEKCNNYTDIPVTSQSCKCITFTSNNSFAGSYTYTQCSTGTPVTAIIPAFGIINVCGSNPSVDIEAVDITLGGPCITNDECKIPPPVLIPQRCNAGGLANYNSWRMETTWQNPQYIFELISFKVNGIEQAAGGDVLTVNAPGDLVTAAGLVYPAETYVQNINNWLNSIPEVASTGFVFYDDMSVIDTPDVSTTFAIRIKRTIPATGSVFNYWYVKNNTCIGFSCNANRLVEPTCIQLYQNGWTCNNLEA